MCGIAGVLNEDGARADPALLRRMIGRIAHRGPDDNGVFTDGPAGLAHARLSIIDLAGGHQPMPNRDKSLWVTFNGEIFNYLELREELSREGYPFATHSDTEVILALYEREGEDCVRRFNGQWAFALWDARKKSLFLSRDRMGVRPLFYARQGGAFAFGSEVKALFEHPAVKREADPAALDQIFTFWCALPPRTFFKGVSELPPGHSLRLDRAGLSVRAHWALSYGRNGAATPSSEEEAAARLRELLIDATRLRLRSDVPVGAYLSGGLDSTVTAALIRNFTSAPLKTFSVAFEDAEFDESRYQREAAAHLGTEHQEVRCSDADIGRVFPEVVWHAETALVRTAPAPLFLLSRLVRRSGHKVVMTGEGADETLGGYDIFKEAKIRRFWAARPDSAFRPLLLRRLYPYLPSLRGQSDVYRRAFFRVGEEGEREPFFSHRPRWELTAKLKAFFSEEVRSALAGRDALAEAASLLPPAFGGWDGFSRAQFLESAFLLPGYILSSQGDRVAMAHAVEGRYPFLDPRVVEFAAGLPPRWKMKALNEKYILKKAAGDLIPESVRRRPKQPYRAPDGKCFFGPSAPAYAAELLSPARIARDGLFAPEAVENLARKFREGRAVGAKDNMALVGILSAQLAVDQFVNNFRPRT